MKTKVTITDISVEDLVDLFSTAFYSSSYLSADYEEYEGEDVGETYEEVMARILLDGGEITITDGYADGVHYGKLRYTTNEDDSITYHVKYDDIFKGLERAANGDFDTRPDVSTDFSNRNKEFARSSFWAFANDDTDWDATTADCLMQIILFDEIIYG